MTAAQSHSDDMALNDFFGHTGSDGSSPLERILAAGYSNTYISENLAAGVSSPEDVVDRWMNETPPNDGHKQNIINCNFTDIGVGYAWAASSGYVHFWTQDLGKLGQATLTPNATRTATPTRTPTPEFTPTATWTPSITPTPTQTPVNLAPLVIEYQYDPLYRLTGTNYTGALTDTFAYSYDAVGNRLTQNANGVVTNYGYDNANQLTSVNGQTYTWDNNGNLLNDGVNTYVYDQANRLIGVGGQGTGSSYAYNGVGDRLQQTVGSVTTNYALDLNSGLTQVLADGTNSYLYGVGRVAQYDNAMQYFGADGLGSVRQIYNAAGVVRRNTLYDPFGNVLTTNGAATSAYGYTGEQTDATGLVYLRSRYLDPTSGRFISRDVWEGDYQRPLSLNKWNYVEAQPINFTDPSGLCTGGVGNDEILDSPFSASWNDFTNKIQTGLNKGWEQCQQNLQKASEWTRKKDYGRAIGWGSGFGTWAERSLKWIDENNRDWELLRDLDCPAEMRDAAGQRVIGKGFFIAGWVVPLAIGTKGLFSQSARKVLARAITPSGAQELPIADFYALPNGTILSNSEYQRYLPRIQRAQSGFPLINPSQVNRLSALARESNCPLVLCGGFSETAQGIENRAIGIQFGKNAPVGPFARNEFRDYSFRNTRIPYGLKDLDYWTPKGTDLPFSVKERMVKILFGEDVTIADITMDNYHKYWQTLPDGSVTFLPNGNTIWRQAPWQRPFDWPE